MGALTEKKFLTDDEISRLVVTLERHRGERDSILIRLALATGSRGIELLQLKPCDLGNRRVTIYGAKGSNDRTIPILDNLLWKELLHYINENNVGLQDRVFPITTRRYRQIWESYRVADKGAHSLRHTFGVRLYNNCNSIATTKQLLGHKQVQNTMVYLDFVEGQRGLTRKMKGMWNKKLDDE